MKYLLLLYRGAEDLPAAGSPEAVAMMAAYGAANQAMAAAGVLLDCAPLRSAARTVRVRNGELLLTDGPAAELKEQIGGYTLIECADLDEAVRWAATIPAAHDHSVVIRPVVPVQVPR